MDQALTSRGASTMGATVHIASSAAAVRRSSSLGQAIPGSSTSRWPHTARSGVATAQRCGRDRMGRRTAGQHVPMADDRSPMRTFRPPARMRRRAHSRRVRRAFDRAAGAARQASSRPCRAAARCPRTAAPGTTRMSWRSTRRPRSSGYGSPGSRSCSGLCRSSSGSSTVARRSDVPCAWPTMAAGLWSTCWSVGGAIRPPRARCRRGHRSVRALLGGRPGQTVRVELPDGRDRQLRILAVTPRQSRRATAALESDAAAA